MKLRIVALNDRLRSSLFVEPMLFLLGAVLLAAVTLAVDDRVSSEFADLPFGFESTVESARAVLSTVASATITVAGIAFSVALLVLQLASSQYSPRVVQGLFRDPFNKRVMGLVIGTFAYCLVVLRAVRSGLSDGDDPVVPNVSVAVAVLLGISSVLAIVAFINHNAHTMDVSEILHTVTTQTTQQLEKTWPLRGEQSSSAVEPGSMVGEPMIVTNDCSGWVQYVDRTRLAGALPSGTFARLELRPGQFAVENAPLCTIWNSGSGNDGEGSDVRSPDEIAQVVRAHVHVDRTRTLSEDAGYGVRQLADVALRALSPGVNDPTTAHDAIVHLAAVLAVAYRREPPVATSRGERGQVVSQPSLGHAELTAVAFDEIRRAAASLPRVAIDVLRAMGTLCRADHGCTDCVTDLHRHARLVVEECERADLHPADLEDVRRAYHEHVLSVPAPADVSG